MMIKMGYIFILFVILAHGLSPSYAEEKDKIDPYQKVLAKFEELPAEKKLPYIVTLKIHSHIQMKALAPKNIDKASLQEQILIILFGLEINNNLIDFATSAKSDKFVKLFKDENFMLENRMNEKISHKEFKKLQDKFNRDTHKLFKIVSDQKGFKALITSSEQEIAYFHKHHFLNALRRATQKFKQ